MNSRTTNSPDEAAVFGMLRRAVAIAGSQKAFAHTHHVPEACLSATMAGGKPPSAKLLAAIGVRRVTHFEMLDGGCQ